MSNFSIIKTLQSQFFPHYFTNPRRHCRVVSNDFKLTFLPLEEVHESSINEPLVLKYKVVLKLTCNDLHLSSWFFFNLSITSL